VYIKNSGDIYVNQELVDIKGPKDSIKLGISTVYQDPQLIESFSVFENIYLGAENDKDNQFSMLSRKKMKERALNLLDQYPLDIDLDKKVYSLTAIEREIVAILKALSKECKILILDEPTSILTEKEKYILFDFIRLLKSRGVSIIYITHHLDEVSQICDSFTVFNAGQDIAHEEIIDKKVDAFHIAELMIGQKLNQLYPSKEDAFIGDEVLGCNNISLTNKLDDITLQSRVGTILGIFGLVGSGIDELAKILFGAMRYDTGELLIDGSTVQLCDPKTAINNRIFLVPGSRKAEGLIGEFSIAKNLSLSKLENICNNVDLVKTKQERIKSKDLVNSLNIATTDIHKQVQFLSGGNQQKVVIGKGLFTDAQCYIFCEPTVGVDVGAKKGIYETIRKLSKKSAIIIISSDPEEILGNSDEIMVLNKGKLTLSCKAEDTTLNKMLVKATSNQ
jgi:ribose transport system ATP-binding protein